MCVEVVKNELVKLNIRLLRVFVSDLHNRLDQTLHIQKQPEKMIAHTAQAREASQLLYDIKIGEPVVSRSQAAHQMLVSVQ